MDNKIALITGASRGIGAATALLAAQQGWAVVVNYHSNQAAADTVVQQIRAAGGTAVPLAKIASQNRAVTRRVGWV